MSNHYYSICERCTAKWFGGTKATECPRCGSDRIQHTRATPPWSTKAPSPDNIAAQAITDSASGMTKVLQSEVVRRAYRDKKATLVEEFNLDPERLPTTLSRTRIQQLSVLSLSCVSAQDLGLSPVLQFSNTREDCKPVPRAFYMQLWGEVYQDGLEVEYQGGLWTVLSLEPFDSQSQRAVRPGHVIFAGFRFDAVCIAPACLIENDL